MGQLGLMKTDPDMPDEDVTAEYLLDNIWVVGSPDEVAAKIRAIHEEVGGFGVLLAMGHEWQPKDKWTRSMTLLKEEVLPKLADLE
jgi:alkanesulfonate monooxygenase SsuD/methylene tetrahydromethanopterin reductase-like flavin-dependent oxidoreductase (luciferase family)